MGVRVRVGFKDSVGVQSGQIFPSGTFGAHERRRAEPSATNCWPEAIVGGWGGAVAGVLGSAESAPPPGAANIRLLHSVYLQSMSDEQTPQ